MYHAYVWRRGALLTGHVICWHLLLVPTATSLLIASQTIFIYLQHPHTSTWRTLHIHLQCAQCYIHVQCICTCTWICTWNMEKSVIETLHVASSHGWHKCQSRLKRKCPYSTEVHIHVHVHVHMYMCSSFYMYRKSRAHGFHIQNISWGIIHAVYKPATYMSTVKILLWIHSISLMKYLRIAWLIWKSNTQKHMCIINGTNGLTI